MTHFVFSNSSVSLIFFSKWAYYSSKFFRTSSIYFGKGRKDLSRGRNRLEQHHSLRTRALMQGLRTRLEYRHRVFVRTEKTLWKKPQLPSRTRTWYPHVNSARLSHCAIARTCILTVRLWFLSQTDVPIVIIIITDRPRLPLLKPE